MSRELTDAEVKVLTELSYEKSIEKGNKMNKELTPLEALKELFSLAYGWKTEPTKDYTYYRIIETALKDYEELLKIDCKQNTINDFYPDTISMIKDLINLYETKVIDNLKSGELYTKDRLLEILGFASRYVLTFAHGGEFNETEKIGINAKKLKALEIIKEKLVDMTRLKEAINRNDLSYYNYYCYEPLTKQEHDLLKEVLL